MASRRRELLVITVVATFCLLHGAWHDPFCWQPLAARLRANGHRAVAPDLPFHDPAAGYYERVGPAVQALERVGSGPLVVVGHSMASTYAPLVGSALEVSLVVHLCPRLGSFRSPPNAPAMFREGVPWPAERADGTTAWDRQTAIEVLYRRLPPATGRALAERLRPLAPVGQPYPRQRHASVANAVVYASEDEIFEPGWERFMAVEVLAIDPVELPGGHFPMLEDADALGDLLERLALEHRN
jgi:pimeloyl-ACP methyl ester carboxylesterase